MFSGQLLFEVYYALLSLQIFCLNEQAAYLGFVRNRCDLKKIYIYCNFCVAFYEKYFIPEGRY